MRHIEAALKCRPPPRPFQRAMIQQVVARDSFPLAVPCDHITRFSDEPYRAEEEENKEEAVVCVFATTEHGNSAMIMITGYRPWVRIELPETWTDGDAETLRGKLEKRVKSPVFLHFDNLKRFYGFVPGKDGAKKFRYAKFSFSTFDSAGYAMRLLENPSWGLQSDCQVVDKVKPATMFLNDLGLTPSDWIKLSYDLEDTSISRRSNCQMEVLTDISRIRADPTDTIAPILIMSFDGEMFSNDGCFPSVVKGDNTIYIGASFWTYGTPISSITRIMLGVGDVHAKDSDIVLQTFSTTKEMIEAFRDIIVAADPDVVTGWNTYGFDFPFLHEDYESYFLPPEERGSEKVQIDAIHAAREVMGLDPASVPSAAAIYSQLSSKRNMFEWTKKAEKDFGSKNIKLLKSAKDANNLSLFGMTDDNEDEETDTISATVAAKMRRSLRDFEMGTMASAAKKSVSFMTFLEGATKEQLEMFWARMPAFLRKPSSMSGRGMYLSRFASEKSKLVEKRMNNAAKGDNTYYFWGMTGRTTVDLMQIIKDDKKPDDNSLRHAAETYLTDSNKMDLSAQEMFKAYSDGPAFRWPIVEYCARDCDIPLRLIDKLKYIPIWTEMSRVCYTSSNEVVNSGQQVKVFNLISRFVWNEFVINVRDSGWPESQTYVDDRKRKPDYQGATVIEPEVGFYQDCISTLDFESLYPSIIRYYNLCPSTLVLDGYAENTETHEIQHNVLQGIKDGDPIYKQETRKYTFVNHVQGVLPRLLKRLIDARKSVKKLMAKEDDPTVSAILNGRQNGIKVACNSVYGFCGVAANRGLLPCKPVAAVTTLKGRLFIDAAKDYVEKHYEGSRVVYGDSVTGDTPLLIKFNDGSLDFLNIDDLCQMWEIVDEKEYGHFSACVWSDVGWTEIRRVIRHRANKPIVRVLTHTGCVDVTTDHSLLLPDGTKTSSLDIGVGTELMHTDLPSVDVLEDMSEDCAYAYGLFYAEGSCGHYDCPSGFKSSWAISNADNDVFPRAIQGLKERFAEYDFKILDTMKSSAANKLVACGKVKDLVTNFRACFYDAKAQKKVPKEILNSSLPIKRAFWEGYYAGDGSKCDNGYIRLSNKGKIGSAGLYYIMSSIGMPVSINIRDDKMSIYALNGTRNVNYLGYNVDITRCAQTVPKCRRNRQAVKKIKDLGTTSDYVYDLETANHHFSAGIGRIVVHNTDSIMIHWGKIEVREAAERGIRAAKEITAMLRSGSVAAIGGAGSLANRDVSEACSAVTLAYEKTYRPYLLLKKKNYAGLKYTSSGDGFKTEIDMKGIDAVRRDRPKLLRDTSNAILQALLMERSMEKAMSVMSESLQMIASGKAPLEDYILSKSLKSHYASQNHPHLMAWKRMIARGDEDIPPIGSRMPFIVVAGPGKLYDKTEHPSHVKSKGLSIDKKYYVESLKNPLMKLLQFAVDNDRLTRVFREAIERAAMSGISSLRSFATSTESGRKRNLLDFFNKG